MVEVRDPIHGAIRLSAGEIALVDDPFVQRLRGILQTGFSYLPFPGATHSRYSHCLGVTHLAGMAFDRIFEGYTFSSENVRVRFREAVRLAALTHDIGHSPFSHCTEFAMPPRCELNLVWMVDGYSDEGRASHEDYTVAILSHPRVTQIIETHFSVTSRHIAALISREVEVGDDFFMEQGLDYRSILSQIISSELDVDRLDYLVRDSYYTGARYGTVDVPWLLNNLRPVVHDNVVSLGLDSTALYAFDDFILSRHHMFLMVYFHHKSVVYEEMLKRHVLSDACEWKIPADLDAYLTVDDTALVHWLRGADCPWAQRITARLPYRRVLERHGGPSDVDLSSQASILEAAGIGVIYAGCTGELSRYHAFGQKREGANSIYVIPNKVHGGGEVQEIARQTKIFDRYAQGRRIARIYVDPKQEDAARNLLKGEV
jgi:HD superfamily phosphohydrolase